MCFATFFPRVFQDGTRQLRSHNTFSRQHTFRVNHRRVKLRNLEQFDGADEICVHRIAEQGVHEVIQGRQQDMSSIRRPLCALHLKTESINQRSCRCAGGQNRDQVSERKIRLLLAVRFTGTLDLYLQVEVELSQKEHEGVELLLSLGVSPGSRVPLLVFYLTSTEDTIVHSITTITAIAVLHRYYKRVTFLGGADGSYRSVG